MKTKEPLSPQQVQKHLEQNLEILEKIDDRFVHKKENWFRQILLLSSTLFGILISLHKGNSHTQSSHQAFLVALVCIVLGILGTAIALYGLTDSYARLKKAHALETRSALVERRQAGISTAGVRKVFVWCENIAYLFYLLGLLALILYIA